MNDVTQDPDAFNRLVADITARLHGHTLHETTGVLAFVFGLTVAGAPPDAKLEMKENFAKAADKAITLLEAAKIKSHVNQDEFQRVDEARRGEKPMPEELAHAVKMLRMMFGTGKQVH